MREAEIKRALALHLNNLPENLPGSFLEEVELSGGEIRADLVHVMDMHCYEIKSEADTLKRLIGQGARYARVFDRVTLVTAERHLKKALPILPSWWGILVLPDETTDKFKQIRSAKPNKRHEPDVLATLLKRDEALHLLDKLGQLRGWKSKSLYQIQAHIAQILSLDELRQHVREYLLKRVGLSQSIHCREELIVELENLATDLSPADLYEKARTLSI
ncbi:MULTISPECIES: sce7726 family protein [Pseudomonas]|uniref:sce7726 family protein n=1 Tax=Pseudomonas TaxID=286 RepID=UPI001E34635C|nr:MULTISPECIES: sce7726 family protein [Pseudomonas]MDQ0651550.1 hypothetical protein [Pseudomonas cedrina]